MEIGSQVKWTVESGTDDFVFVENHQGVIETIRSSIAIIRPLGDGKLAMVPIRKLTELSLPERKSP